MAKNLILEIARMLGVAIGEEFKIRGDDRTCFIDLDGLHLDCHLADDEDNAMLHDLLCGDAEIVKLPWKPEKGEGYYTFGASARKWMVRQQHWTNHPVDLAFLDKGWIYRTRAEAEAALPAVAAEMGVEYEI